MPGNTDPSAIFAGKYDIQCGKAALDTPIMPIATCVRMKQAVRCPALFAIHVRTLTACRSRAASQVRRSLTSGV
jgi:hypothetical protein